jgi:hypothetical protein
MALRKAMSLKMHYIYCSIIASLMICIAFMSWQLLGYTMLYKMHVDYCSELSFSYGYFVGSGSEIEPREDQFHHRLTNTTYEDERLEVEVWPKKNFWLEFSPPRSDAQGGMMVDCSVHQKKHPSQ